MNEKSADLWASDCMSIINGFPDVGYGVVLGFISGELEGHFERGKRREALKRFKGAISFPCWDIENCALVRLLKLNCGAGSCLRSAVLYRAGCRLLGGTFCLL